MKKQSTTPKKPKRKIAFGTWILILGLSITVIFGAIFAYILFGAVSSTGSIIVGNRFLLELEPKIETAKVEAVRTALEGEDFVVESSVNLRSATLRIMVQVKSELTDVQLGDAILKIKDDVAASLPLETYFTSTSDVKMYDLEIHLFNSKEAVSTESFTYHYFIFVKNANMLTWDIQDVSVAANPELKAILLERLNAFESGQ